MKKFTLPTWAGCLLLVLITAIGTWRVWTPITEDSGTAFTLTLESVSANDRTIFLDFGKADQFHIARAPAAEGLLADDAIGREYHITADYHAKRRGSDYYEVYALAGADGTVYLTIEQAEAARRSALPLRLGLFVALDAAACGLLIWKAQQRKKMQQAADLAAQEAQRHEAEDMVS